MMRAVVLVALFSMAACVHRPRYNDVLNRVGASVEGRDGTAVPIVVIDPQSRSVVTDVAISFGEGKSKVTLRPGADGMMPFPLSAKLAKSNPLVEVNRASAGGYELVMVLAPATPQAAP